MNKTHKAPLKCPFCGEVPFIYHDEYSEWSIGCGNFEFGDTVHRITKEDFFSGTKNVPIVDGCKTRKEACEKWDRYVEKHRFGRD